MNDETIEQKIQAKGLTAPRVTSEDIEAEIVSEHYFTADEGVLGAYHAHEGVHQGTMPNDLNNAALPLLTFCVLVLRNGFTVTSQSACASPENFDAEIGREIARERAVNEVGHLLGFRLRDQLASGGDAAPASIDAAFGVSDLARCARRAHEINRAYCEAIGDTSQVPWDEAPEWQRQSACDGVTAALKGQTPEQLHQSWCDTRRADGWVYGETKDAERKTHPCLVPYAELPLEQRVKDHLFRAAVFCD